MGRETGNRRQKDVARVVRQRSKGVEERMRTYKPSPVRQGHAGHRQGGRPEEGSSFFTDRDRRQIRREGLTLDQVRAQIALLRRGTPYVVLDRPCEVGDGIDPILPDQQERLVHLHDLAAEAGRLGKFVPASGAASRMFKEWYRLLEERDWNEGAGDRLVDGLPKWAFSEDLRQALAHAGQDLDRLLVQRRYADVVSFILNEQGLDYGHLPKALLKFHDYPTGSRTALEEHLVEAALYCRDGRGISRLHFTVSTEHLRLVEERLAHVKGIYENRLGVTFQLDVSVQGSSTNTLAVDGDFAPFRLEDGRLCFRPGGHGALLENLNAMDGDIVFVKNIDNIVPDRLKPATVLYKKILCGCLLDLQGRIFKALRMLDSGETTSESWDHWVAFCRDSLHLRLPDDFASMDGEGQRRFLFERLHRPLRVCGMVRNEGEPGGGPFWVRDAKGGQSLQIVEEIQIDGENSQQRNLWCEATHFNPVDLVCGLRDYRGKRFDLRRYVDPQTAIIANKTEKGKSIKALEHPGLWNGAMAFWNTIFVEIPIETFNPVKTVDDLLRPAHQPG